MAALDTLSPIKHGLKLFNMSKENGIYEPSKYSPKVSCGTNMRERKEKKRYLVAITLTIE